MTDPGRLYEASDLYLVAALLVAGHRLAGQRRQRGRLVFGFAPGAELSAAITAYYTGELRVPARAYADQLCAVRGLVGGAAAEGGVLRDG